MAKFEQDKENYIYRDYVTTSLQLIPQNSCLTKKWREIVNPALVDNRTGDEIAQDVIEGAGLHFKE